MFCPFNAGVRLSAWSFRPVPLAKNEPRMMLSPLFGTMFMTSPPVSVSPSDPAVVNPTSTASPTSKT
jgi:hypothetical protein